MNYSTFMFFSSFFSWSFSTNQLDRNFIKTIVSSPHRLTSIFYNLLYLCSIRDNLAANCLPPTFPSPFVHFFIFPFVLSSIKPPFEATRDFKPSKTGSSAALATPLFAPFCNDSIRDTDERESRSLAPPVFGDVALMKGVKYTLCSVTVNLLLCFFTYLFCSKFFLMSAIII